MAEAFAYLIVALLIAPIAIGVIGGIGFVVMALIAPAIGPFLRAVDDKEK